MSELKTLKDLKLKEYKQWENAEGYVDSPLSYHQVKQEMIKWVKKLGVGELVREDLRTIDWIKQFFNLTEDDLK